MFGVTVILNNLNETNGNWCDFYINMSRTKSTLKRSGIVEKWCVKFLPFFSRFQNSRLG